MGLALALACPAVHASAAVESAVAPLAPGIERLVGTPTPMLRAHTTKAFQVVVDELEFAITGYNFRITGRNSVGAGIRQRGHAGFPDMEVIHFCSLERAREVLELDPAYIAQMPCRVMVHSEPRADGGQQVVIQMILLPEQHPDARVRDFARRMNALLADIVAYALEPNLSPLD